ncbi:MAG TPA: hypothetical protein VNV42_09310 [Solirubrobacteraceae bacterium]|nr:hypothetical protein [Solirubrobacteraceae bacterium]
MARTRSRKRRPTGARRAPAKANGAGPAAGGADAVEPAAAATASAASAKKARARAAHRSAGPAARVRSPPTAPTYGERPNAPWHPLPVSELLILIGAIGAALGLARLHNDPSGGGRLLLAGLGAVGVGTIEVTWREHRSGHRSHTVLLAGLLVLVLDTVLVLALTTFVTLPRAFSIALVALDIAVFAVLFKLLRARFLQARHARVIREG